MDRRDKEPRQSELPSTLIPHLYSRPQTPTNDATSTPTLAPLSVHGTHTESEEMNTENLPYQPAAQPSFTLPPPAPLSEGAQQFRPFFNYGTGSPEGAETQSQASRAGLIESPRPIYRHSIGPTSIHHGAGQPYATPIFSDPIFHQSRATASPHASGFVLPPLAPREATPLRSSWGEGEAGPSSLPIPGQYGPGINRVRRGSSQPARMGPHSSAFSRMDLLDNDGERYHRGGSAGREETRGFWNRPDHTPQGE